MKRLMWQVFNRHIHHPGLQQKILRILLLWEEEYEPIE